MPDPRPDTAPPRATTRDRVFGAVGLIAVALALFFLLRGGEEDTGAAPAPPPPPSITVLEPAPGATVGRQLAVLFDTGEEMQQDPSGWVAGGRYHLHAMIDGAELMAAPGQVQPLGGSRYRWVLPLTPGEHRIRLQWSGPDHRTLEEGGSPPITVSVP